MTWENLDKKHSLQQQKNPVNITCSYIFLIINKE